MKKKKETYPSFSLISHLTKVPMGDFENTKINIFIDQIKYLMQNEEEENGRTEFNNQWFVGLETALHIAYNIKNDKV